MLGIVVKPSNKFCWSGFGVMTLALCLIIMVVACGEADSAVPGTTPRSSNAQPSRTEPEPPHYGAGTPSMEERIYKSDVVVLASLQSRTSDLLHFRTLEYLKGSGAEEFTVRYTGGELVVQDNVNAVLFLTLPETEGASGSSQQGEDGASDSSADRFSFTEANAYYKGDLPGGYTIGTWNPVLLPAERAAGAEGTSSGNAKFVTESESPTGTSSPTISLSDLRAKIAWVGGGGDAEDTEAYELCIRLSIDHRRKIRDWETHYGREWDQESAIEYKIASGAGRGKVISDIDWNPSRDPSYLLTAYIRYWLSGPDADFFHTQINDDDTVSSNGYQFKVTTARPLPGGVYSYLRHSSPPGYWPCNYSPRENYLSFLIVVTAPEGTLHETFFDPVTIGSGVGADGSNGALNPAEFSVNGNTTSLTSLIWESGTAVLTLTPRGSLAGKNMDVIDLDGSVPLTLDFDEATEDPGAGTYSWSVGEQPWDDGDLLMLRIRD